MEKFEKVLVTEEYLRRVFDESDNFESDVLKNKRMESSVRTARIGREIALAEGMDPDYIAIACLLLDISFAVPFTDNDYNNHGRDSGMIAKTFLPDLDIDEDIIENILYAIAKHADGDAGYEGNDNIITDIVSYADKIEKYSPVKLFENLESIGFPDMELDEKIEIVSNMLSRLSELENEKFNLESAKSLWMDNIGFQEVFYRKLHKQLLNSKSCMD